MNLNQNEQSSNNAPTNAPAVSSNDKGTVLSVISYLGFLVIVSYFMGKDVPSVKFHIKQGLVLFVIEVILSVIGSVFWMSRPISNLIGLVDMGLLVLIIIGIINAVQHKEKELPLVGQFSKYFKF